MSEYQQHCISPSRRETLFITNALLHLSDAVCFIHGLLTCTRHTRNFSPVHKSTENHWHVGMAEWTRAWVDYPPSGGGNIGREKHRKYDTTPQCKGWSIDADQNIATCLGHREPNSLSLSLSLSSPRSRALCNPIVRLKTRSPNAITRAPVLAAGIVRTCRRLLSDNRLTTFYAVYEGEAVPWNSFFNLVHIVVVCRAASNDDETFREFAGQLRGLVTERINFFFDVRKKPLLATGLSSSTYVVTFLPLFRRVVPSILTNVRTN